MEEKTVEKPNQNLVEEALEKAKSSGNEKGIFESLFSLVKLLEQDSDFRGILDLIEENLPLIRDEQERSQLLNKKISSLLRLEEFEDLLKALDEKRKIKGLSITEKANVLFYESIAYEGLFEIDLAIESLESIEDNISKYSLINKYIKLSLLYSQKKNLEKARESFEYADRLDTYHTNDMFALAESDLYFLNHEYKNALSSFESFFLKSKVKFKYLDRYIYIMLKLKRLDDAYNFYSKYINMPSIRLSRQNRYCFLLSVRELLIEMGKNEELSRIESEMERIKPVFKDRDSFDRTAILNDITKKMSMPITRFDRRKNLVNAMFKVLPMDLYSIIAYVEVLEDGALYYRYTGKEMKEKPLGFDSMSDRHREFFRLSDSIMDYYVDHMGEIKEEKIERFVIENGYKTFGFFFAKYDHNSKNIYNILRNSIFSLLQRLDVMSDSYEREESIYEIMEKRNEGLILMDSNTIEFLSPYSRRLFGSKNSIIKYSDFLLNLTSPLYIDELSKGETIYRSIIIDGEKKKIEFIPRMVSGKLYSIIRDVTEESAINSEKDEFLYRSNLKIENSTSLRNRIESISESYAILGLTIPIIEDGDVFETRDQKINALYDSIHDSINDIGLYYIGENHFVVIKDSVDKRVLKNLYQNICDEIFKLYKYSYSLRLNTISAFISKSLKGKTYTEVKEIMSYGFYMSQDKGGLIVLDNEEKKEYALFKVYESDTIKRIREKKLSLEYYPIVDKKDETIHFFLPRFSLPHRIDYSNYVKILRKNYMESKADMVMFETLVEESKKFPPDARFVIQFNKESIIDQNFIKRFHKAYKDSNLQGRIIVLTDTKSFPEFERGLESIKKMGIHLAANYDFAGPDEKDYENYSMVFISIGRENEYRRRTAELIRDVLRKRVVLVESRPIEGCLLFSSDYRPYTKEKIESIEEE